MKANVKNDSRLLWLIVGSSAVLRFVGVARPLLGNFSSVQIIYAMMARNYRDYSWNIFLPRLDILMFTGKPGIRFLDFPMMSYGVAFLSKLTSLPIDFLGRFWSASFSLASIPLFYRICKRLLLDEPSSLLATFFFAFSPLSIIYGQSFQTDATALFFLLLALNAAFRAASSGVVPSVFFSLVILERVQYIFLYPFFAYLFLFVGEGNPKQKFSRFSFFLLLSLFPLLAWNAFIYGYLKQHPDDVIMSIFHQFKTGTFHRYAPWGFPFLLSFAKNYLKLVLNPIGGVLCVVGLVTIRQLRLVSIWFTLGAVMLFYLTQKAIDMNYYLLALVPPASILAAFLAQRFVMYKRNWVLVSLVAWILISLRFSASSAYGTPLMDRSVMRAAAYIKTHTQPRDLILAAHGSNNDLLFYSNRKGWTFQILDRQNLNLDYYRFNLPGQQLSEMRKRFLQSQTDSTKALKYYRAQGAVYLIGANQEDFDKDTSFKIYLQQRYAVIEKNPDFVFYDLHSSIFEGNSIDKRAYKLNNQSR